MKKWVAVCDCSEGASFYTRDRAEWWAGVHAEAHRKRVMASIRQAETENYGPAQRPHPLP